MTSRADDNVVIAIDGPAGAGKSTIARQLAAELNYSYLDTGAMYRALTLKAMRKHVPLDDEDALVECARKTVIELRQDRPASRVLLDGEDVSREIRSVEVTNQTFYVARAPRVREIMVAWQREMGQKDNVVMEGRDVGTVVFPAATFKFYLDADFQERARRRIRELRDKGQAVDESTLADALKARDEKDFTRKVGPLKVAQDAVVIDSTQLSIPQVVEKMKAIIGSKTDCN